MTFATALVVRLYGLLFRVLILLVPRASEADSIFDILDGEGDERFL
jgi:hypothetical protein